jgi:ATP-dependent Clp protease ATP-binding subunit ClpC
LTEAVRRRPYSVVLLDEVEKAHPEVFNILLQVMEDGRLTDSQAHVVDFRNAVVIMTSNVGTSMVDTGVGMGLRTSGADYEAASYERMRDVVLEKLKQVFRPEFMNRVDEVIVFHALSQEQVTQIVDLLLARVAQRVKEQGLRLLVDDGVKSFLASEGFDRNLGARPLRRAIQRHIEDALSDSLLHGTFQEGDTIEAVMQDGAVAFRRVEDSEEPGGTSLAGMASATH